MIRRCAEGDVSGGLLDRPEAFDASGAFRVGDVEADEAGRGVHPAAGLHDVGEQPDDAVRDPGGTAAALSSMMR